MEKLISFLTRRSARIYVAAAVLWVLGIGLIDARTDVRIHLAPLYLPAVFLITWFATFRAAMSVCVVTTVTWAIANRLNHNPAMSDGYFVWNVSVIFFAYACFALIVGALRTQTSRASRDPLTHLANRRTVDHYLRRETARSRRMGQPFTVGYIDVDNFKSVNDRYGHDAGDKLLQAVGRILTEHIRPTDLAARLGGDEFAVVLSATGKDSGRKMFEKLRTRLAQEMVAKGWPITFSIGVMTYSSPPLTQRAILKSADELMYIVKQKGKNRLECMEENGRAKLSRILGT
jgi:diguanylate cyclase (GGDEF)-like protein